MVIKCTACMGMHVSRTAWVFDSNFPVESRLAGFPWVSSFNCSRKEALGPVFPQQINLPLILSARFNAGLN